jgi:hypothetical protein
LPTRSANQSSHNANSSLNRRGGKTSLIEQEASRKNATQQLNLTTIVNNIKNNSGSSKVSADYSYPINTKTTNPRVSELKLNQPMDFTYLRTLNNTSHGKPTPEKLATNKPISSSNNK